MTIKSLYEATNTSPDDLQPGDVFAAKVVATVGRAGDWALYIGPSDWTDEHVKASGNKLGEGEVPFQYLMQRLNYRH